MHKRWLGLPALGIASSFSPAVYAQEDGGARRSGVLEEVVVTARKREENIQETPIV